jgi:hypothetical protein
MPERGHQMAEDVAVLEPVDALGPTVIVDGEHLRARPGHVVLPALVALAVAESRFDVRSATFTIQVGNRRQHASKYGAAS